MRSWVQPCLKPGALFIPERSLWTADWLATVLVSMAGSITALGVAFAEFFGYFIAALATDNFILSVPIHILNRTVEYSLSMGMGPIVAVVAILLLSTFKSIGMVLGKRIQNIFTIIKIGTVVIFVAAGFTIEIGAAVESSFNPGCCAIR